MLQGRLKFTSAEQRTEERSRQAWRIGFWIWTPVFVAALLAGWFITFLGFFKHSPLAWLSLVTDLIVTAAGIRLWKRFY